MGGRIQRSRFILQDKVRSGIGKTPQGGEATGEYMQEGVLVKRHMDSSNRMNWEITILHVLISMH